MNRIDVMVDIETLGKSYCPPVFQLVAKAFDIRTGKILSTFKGNCDITTSKSEVEEATVIWWAKTDFRLFVKLITDGVLAGKTEEKMIQDFVEWFNSLECENSNKFLWGNGILFDNRIIKAKCDQYNIAYPVFYRNDLDMRTIIEIAAMKMGFDDQKAYRDSIKFEGTAHDADCDVDNQIKHVCRAYHDLIKPLK